MTDFSRIGKETLHVGQQPYQYYPLHALSQLGFDVQRLPYSIRVLLEAALRQRDGLAITDEHIAALAGWNDPAMAGREIPFMPARIVLQDFTGVPAVADLAAMRSWLAQQGGDPAKVNPLIPVDLVIDHSVMVDEAGHPEAFASNIEHEFARNGERYRFLRWAQKAFADFRVVPPGTGIVHQVNLEYLATLVRERETADGTLLYPDSLVGTDSHTTMIDGLGVVGWGVGGIEAEACMLGQPLYLNLPEVIGVRVSGTLQTGVTATDLALFVTQMLRREGVVGKFVEFFGPGIAGMSLPDRATIANMSPEYGATMGYFPVDMESLNYLRQTGRDERLVATAEAYYRAQQLLMLPENPEPSYTKVLSLDLDLIQASLAGPKRPQDRINLADVQASFSRDLSRPASDGGFAADPGETVQVQLDDETVTLRQGSVVIAAITSCTNTSNPSVMIGAGLIAKKATQLGLKPPAYVKTSLTPGSQVVTEYLNQAGLIEPLEALGFHIVGYGCCTCIGNSGPLHPAIEAAIEAQDLTVAGVLSGNRNFEGRIHPLVKANYLASPMLVIAYALAGTVDINLITDPLGTDAAGRPIYLSDLWPDPDTLNETVRSSLNPEMFRTIYRDVFTGPDRWNQLDAPIGDLYAWDDHSTYIQEPPFFTGLADHQPVFQPFSQARILALLGDTVTTDHISPAGSIAPDSPAGRYLRDNGVEVRDFNAYGARRGNHEVMMRGTLANRRIRNQLVPDIEGGVTRFLPDGQPEPIYDASMRYQDQGTDLVIIAGKEYGTGSSRDWAAKGTRLLGVKAVLAESYERIHRSNLVGMGILPLQFVSGDTWQSLGLTGEEILTLADPDTALRPGQMMTLKITDTAGRQRDINVIARLDSQMEIVYYLNGGILQTVLLDMMKS